MHELYEDPEVIAAVGDRWGDDVLSDGVADRPAIARAAFASDEDRAWLEGLLWPRVGERVMEFREAHGDARALVVEVPLLFESGMDQAFDATIAVVADEAVREERAGARGHAAVSERTARQLTQQEKADRATYVVPNDGSLEDLEDQLSAVLDSLTTP